MASPEGHPGKPSDPWPPTVEGSSHVTSRHERKETARYSRKKAAIIVSLFLPAAFFTSGCIVFKLLKAVRETTPQNPAVDLKVPGYRVAVPESGGRKRAVAGVGRIDLTPPPGFPNGGDAIAGAVSRGYWTRLYARAFYFEGENRRRLVMVSADLFSIPEALHARVAYLVNSDRPRLARLAGLDPPDAGQAGGISPDELIIAATHTHQGPGNFLSSKIYNSFGSPYYGFSESLFAFLADRIAAAVLLAQSDAYRGETAPVSLAVYHQADSFSRPCPQDIGPASGNRCQLTRNRATFAFDLNPDRDTITKDLNPAAICDGPLCPDSTGVPAAFRDGVRGCEPFYGWEDGEKCPRLHAVDPRLTLLAIRRDEGKTQTLIGLLVFFAAHPTVLLPTAPLNSSDFSGVAVAELEAEHGQHTVVGFFNGSEGDIHMRRLRRDFRDVRRLGRALASNVRELLKADVVVKDASVAVTVSRRDVSEFAMPSGSDLTKRANKEFVCPGDEWQTSVLARVPMYGVAGLGGGEGDRTVLYDMGWREGIHGQPADGQGVKVPGLDSTVVRELRLTKILAPPEDFPQHLPVTYATIGPLALATVPGEPTVAMGYRIRKHLMPQETCERRAARPTCLALVGLANAYVSYIATPDEYEAQEYAGASTMWGPQEGPVLGCGLISLKENPRPPRTQIEEQHFAPGPPPNKPFGVGFAGDPRQSPLEELGDILLDAPGRPARQLPWFEWQETAKDCHGNTLCDDFEAQSHRRVSIDEAKGGTWQPRKLPRSEILDDDQLSNFVTTLLDGTHPPTRRWASIWAAKALEMSPPHGRFRFHIHFPGGETGRPDECSKPFDLPGYSGRVPTEESGCPASASPANH